MMCHKYASGQTITFYGTEGEGVSFIGNKSDINTSDGGAMALKLFQKFIEGNSKNALKYIWPDVIQLLKGWIMLSAR